MKHVSLRTLIVFLLFAALLLSACGVAPATTSAPPVQDTPALPADTPTSAPAVPTDTLPAEPEPTQAPASPTPEPPTSTPISEVTPTNTPAATATPKDCTDLVEFVTDVTVKDSTEFKPGEKFTKTWRLRNTGTCTWTKEYALVHVEGDTLSAASPQNLAADVAPGQSIDISVEMVAPASSGSYRGNWQLRSPEGKNFGIGKDADKSFYVQIAVGQTTSDSDLDLGSPDWTDTFDSASGWYMVKTDNTTFEVEDGQLVMTAKETGQAEEWGLSSRGGVTDFYIEATFTTGETCEGLDRYGMLLRAPDPNAGYVFAFSCDGRFRLYKWDGENYDAMQEWKASGHILAGPEQTNRLGFWAKGSSLKLYANGRLLAEFEDDTFDEGRFGLLVGATKTENFQAFVEEVRFWSLD